MLALNSFTGKTQMLSYKHTQILLKMGVFSLWWESKSLPVATAESKGVCVIIRPHACSRTWIESSADHAREDDEDEGQQLQIGSQD